jgi:hypothetical protein
MLNAQEGKALMQTWHRSRLSSKKVLLHLEKAKKKKLQRAHHLKLLRRDPAKVEMQRSLWKK